MVTLHHGDCLDVLKTLPDNSVDSIVTDPPYGLAFMGKRWDYDIPSIDIWRECLRVLKPGGHALIFGGTRTYHRMTCRVEDAGFEIRDCIMWLFGSGFPKSHDVSKAIDREAGAEREVVRTVKKTPSAASDNLHEGWKRPWAEDHPKTMNITAPATEAAKQWQGWGTALKPALEPITVARKPLAGTVAENVLQWGVGGLNIDGCRVGRDADDVSGWSASGSKASENRAMSGANYAREAKPDAAGRWPANLIHDGSDEVVALFPMTGGGAYKKSGGRNLDGPSRAFGAFDQSVKNAPDNYGDSGSAARFFFRAGHEKEDLLFCRAKAILSAWKLTKGVQPCSQENASVAESSLCLSRQAVVSVLSDAVIAASRGDRLLSDARGLSTTATESECERLCETLITAMLISESVALPAPSQDVLIQNGCHVNVAAIQKPTDTMTITISLPKSGGYAEHVTFSIMPSSMAHGARGLNDRFRYCAKASRADRDEGLEGMPKRGRNEVYGNGLNTATKCDPAMGHTPDSVEARPQVRNHHPTVKPTDLMRYLCRLITPPNGVVLDPFMGSGSTGKAAVLEGFGFIGIEREAEYVRIASARIEHAHNQHIAKRSSLSEISDLGCRDDVYKTSLTINVL